MYISPMLLNETNMPFNNENYITELKFDGIRLILSNFDSVQLYTRHKNEVTSIFPELLNLNVPSGTVLDGEIISTDSNGKPDFEAIMSRFHSNSANHDALYCIFDILYYKGKSVMGLPLIKRKQILNKLSIKHPNVLVIPFIHGHTIQYFNEVKNRQLEGCIMKLSSSIYRPKTRSKQWIKIVNYHYTTVNIIGYSKDKFGLLLQYENGGQAGYLEFMTPKSKRIFHQLARENEFSESNNFVHLNPIRCKVKYRNKTNSGKLRLPVFQSFEQ